jgi:hypothetical protein
MRNALKQFERSGTNMSQVNLDRNWNEEPVEAWRGLEDIVAQYGQRGVKVEVIGTSVFLARGR